MPTVPLPNDPNLEQLRKQAKTLRDLARAGAPGALDLVAEFHPKGAHAVSLTGAQLVIARRHGFASWARLKQHLDVVARYRRAPDQVDAAADVADEFLRLACLRYGDDDAPSRWRDAQQLLVQHPSLPSVSIHVAAATADTLALERHLAGDAALARAEGGPFQWEPLLYLAYARHDAKLTRDAAVRAAQLLIDHGADPNAGYLWHGTYPFTALTGAFGSGELGVSNQPPHPQADPLALLLLESGADANDGQTLYNRRFGDDDSHLVMLLTHGLGRGDGGPWRVRLGHAIESPTAMVRSQLRWAVMHDQFARVQLLVDSGVDFHTSFHESEGTTPWAQIGRTPTDVAALNGNVAIVEFLVSRGASLPALDGADALVAALLASDRTAIDRLRVHAEDARLSRPGLVVWAAARRRPAAIAALVELGWDINALGRSDVPVEQPWETALHEAAGNGDAKLVQLLLSLGANPNIHDRRFNAPPLGWARHFNQTTTIALLEPLTR